MKNEINGFVIVKDLGSRISAGRKRKFCISICKVCKNEFECYVSNLQSLKSCGCYKKTKYDKVPSEINGFKIIKDLGKTVKRRVIAICKVCNNEFNVQMNNLHRQKHCGCKIKNHFPCSYKKEYPRLFIVYKGMISRCLNRNHKSFNNYGNRGITICNEWLKNADSFCRWALANGYKETLTLDRIDSLKGYYPENCRWTDFITQNRNARTNKLSMELAKQIRQEDRNTMTVEQIANKYGIARTTASAVIHNYTWKEEWQ